MESPHQIPQKLDKIVELFFNHLCLFNGNVNSYVYQSYPDLVVIENFNITGFASGGHFPDIVFRI